MVPWGFLIACFTQSMGRDISLSQGDVQVQAPFPVVSWLDPWWAFGPMRPMRFLAVSPSITCFLNLTSYFYYFYLNSRFSSPKSGKSNIVFFCGLLLNVHITLVLFISFFFFFFHVNCTLISTGAATQRFQWTCRAAWTWPDRWGADSGTAGPYVFHLSLS